MHSEARWRPSWMSAAAAETSALASTAVAAAAIASALHEVRLRRLVMTMPSAGQAGCSRHKHPKQSFEGLTEHRKINDGEQVLPRVGTTGRTGIGRLDPPRRAGAWRGDDGDRPHRLQTCRRDAQRNSSHPTDCIAMLKGSEMTSYSVAGPSRRDILKVSAALAGAQVFAATGAAGAAPEGQITWGVHVSLAPSWFDPAETPGIITPYMVLYALHDAVVKPMPGQPQAPSLAESWTASEDALTYEFVVRRGAKFHNGDDVTAEDVKFSFERYRGASQQVLRDRVAAVETQIG